MIGTFIDSQELLAASYGGEQVLAIYVNGQKLWPSSVVIPDTPENVLSCFALGWWEDSYPWTDDTSWKD